MHHTPDSRPTWDGGCVDQIAVELACTGERVALTRQELRLAVRRLVDAGLSVAEVARTLRVSDRTVVRYKAADRRPAAA